MDRTVCIIQGHPHAGSSHLCHAIAESYAKGARLAGAGIRTIDIGAMDIALLRDPAEFARPPEEGIGLAQQAIADSHHIVVIFPLWLGAAPAVVKAFFEQVCRNNFAIEAKERGGLPTKKLMGRSARVIVTMGMPAFAYRFMFGAHGVRALERSILGMSGVSPVRETLIGNVGALTSSRAQRLLARMHALGERLS